MIDKKTREEAKQYVLKTVKEHDVKFVWLWFTDILGFLKSLSVGVNELETTMEEGMGFDGSSIQGFARIDESDMVAVPDPATFQLLPWMPGSTQRWHACSVTS
jgi:glutamine synthetase